MSKNKSLYTLLLIIVLFSLETFAQRNSLDYPKGQFMFPIKPGQQNFLSGGMGDLRANHFHAGIDIKTDGKEGLPVYATFDGYVSELRVQTAGYGNVVFITHPNGYISVYGHLKTFAEPLATFIKQKRIENQSFEIKLNPNNQQFPIKKGQIIGLSGNTGGSGGPHLHFEIRDLANNILNPLYFGFKEIIDNIPPIFRALQIKPLDINAKVNSEFAKKTYFPQKKDGKYTISSPIKAIGKIGLSLDAIDKMNGADNSNGVSCIELIVDGKEIYNYHLEKYSNDQSIDMNVHTDYANEKNGGNRLHKLFIEDGNINLPIYKRFGSNGKINIEENKTHNVSIKIWDAYENGSELNFEIEGKNTPDSSTFVPNNIATSIKTSIEENTLIIKALNPKQNYNNIQLKIENSFVTVPLNYLKNKEAVYLWDLRKGLPKLLKLDTLQKNLSLTKVINPAINETFHSDALNISFEEGTLYDTLYLETNKTGKKNTISNASIPIKKAISISHKVDTLPAIPNKSSAYYVFRDRKKMLKSNWNGRMVNYKSTELGNFEILTDITPPAIKLNSCSGNYFSANISDDLSGIKEFKAFIDGKFVLTDYDFKKALIWSVKKDSSENFIGKLQIKVTDNQNNETILEKEITQKTTIEKKAIVKEKNTASKKSQKPKKEILKKEKKKKKK
ncbi:MAG: M23 family metallopeptidase [Pseudarcicella sp.]|nr:M23 family metallopeptidase [Pseudarcicella sp.]